MQTHHTLKRIKDIMEKNKTNDKTYPLIMVGDFNSLSDSSVYKYLRDGRLNTKDVPDPIQNINFLHPFKLKSAYEKINEPYSNITDHFCGCLDYIWFDSTSLELVGLLNALQPSDYAEFKALPSPHQPSDHTSLFVKLNFI